jgi:hypothetical protein
LLERGEMGRKISHISLVLVDYKLWAKISVSEHFVFVHAEILKNYEAVCTVVLVPLLTLAHFSFYAGDGALYRVDINTGGIFDTC